MSNSFHSKWHKHNHHTIKESGSTEIDASHDPIASMEDPFQGDFHLRNGSIVTEAINLPLFGVSDYDGGACIVTYACAFDSFEAAPVPVCSLCVEGMTSNVRMLQIHIITVEHGYFEYKIMDSGGYLDYPNSEGIRVSYLVNGKLGANCDTN